METLEFIGFVIIGAVLGAGIAGPFLVARARRTHRWWNSMGHDRPERYGGRKKEENDED
jgi:hypothetical protein